MELQLCSCGKQPLVHFIDGRIVMTTEGFKKVDDSIGVSCFCGKSVSAQPVETEDQIQEAIDTVIGIWNEEAT